MPRVSDSPPQIRKPVPFDVWRIGASGVASVIGFSALIPFGAIRLEALGHSAAEIGFFSAMPWLAILVVAPFVTLLARVFGGARLYVHGAFVSIPLPLVFAFSQDYLAWCAANFVIGAIAALRWIVSEAWVADLAPPTGAGASSDCSRPSSARPSRSAPCC